MTQRIAKLVTDGFYEEAINLYSELHSSSFIPNKFNFPFLLKACVKLKAFSQAQLIHAQLIKAGFQSKIHTATALTDMYMKFNLTDSATKVFEEIPEPTIASFNAAISGFSRNGFFKEAVKIFGLVGTRNLKPDSVTVSCLLSQCGDHKQGMQLHSWAIKSGVEADIYAGTALLSMYLKCGDMISAERLYEWIPCKNVVCYNSYMSGLFQNGIHLRVLNMFNDMRRSSNERPNSVTLISVASTCSNLKYLRLGRQVHGYTVKVGLGFETKVGTSLVDMYSKCGSWGSAYAVFKELHSIRNMVTWNSMIAGMMLNNQYEIAIELFGQLKDGGLKPDSTTWNSMINGFSQLGKEAEAFMFFRKMLSDGVMPSVKSITSLLPVCSALSTLGCGQEIHAYVFRRGINEDEFIATALIDMYMKCGKSASAHKVFNQFSLMADDPAIWNAMISGYGRNGDNEAASEIFQQMLEVKVRPNSGTFNCMLSVCSHTGKVDLLWQVFRLMVVNYGLEPTSEQLNIVVDLLGRAGQLKEAQGLLEEIVDPSVSVLMSLLGAAKHYADSELGEELIKRLLVLEPDNPIPFVILSNIYAEEGKWKEVEKIRNIMSETKLRKLPGYSKIGVT